MCKIINLGEYKRFKAAKRTNMVRKSSEGCDSSRKRDLVTEEWAEEYMQKGRGLSKLIFHIIEQYGYISCRYDRKYVFEDVKRDVTYHEMYPEIEEKRFKAPLWVKVDGEWYFVEAYTDCASENALNDKWTEVGNHDVKGFFVDLYGLNRRKLKRMLEENDVAGAVKEISSRYEEGFHSVMGAGECRASVSIGGEKIQREYTYKLLELDLYEYAVLEGTEQETGNRHLVLLPGTRKPKEHADYFRKKYGAAGLPLLYGKWNPVMENWKSCIRKQKKLYKRLVLE